MLRKRRLPVLGFVAVFAAVGGTSWAISQDNDRGPEGFVTPTRVLAKGSAPSGLDYSISHLDPGEFGKDSTEALCIMIKTRVAATQGCELAPDEDGLIDGQPFRPSISLLGADRFFTTLAPAGVTSMEVTTVGEGKAASSQSIDAGSVGRLLVVHVGGPVVSSRDPESSRQYDVRLLDADGNTVRRANASDPD
jgi:hypothetical protein